MSTHTDDLHIPYRTLDGEDAHLSRNAVAELRAALGGRVSTSGDSGYDLGRRVWNAMVEHRPAVIGHAASVEEVRRLVVFARENSMLLSIRGGGHHIAGNAVAEGGLEIDLSGMREVTVDADRRTARICGGALLGDVDHATQTFGLAVPTGINSTTGFAGLCLGGGFGWLTRKLGLTVDNVMSAKMVTADGDVRIVSASRDADLFWAIRGGGGNFGVVTSFEVKVHAVGPLVHAGLVVFPRAQAKDVLRGWRDLTMSAPDELTVWTLQRKAPPLPFLPPETHGTDVVVLLAVWAGDANDGARATEPLLRLGTPIGQMLGAQPFVEWQKMFDPMLAFGARNYWKTNEFTELADGALDTLIAGAGEVPGPESEVFVASVGGAMGRVAGDATAFAGRDSRYVMNVHGRWRDAADDAKVRTWARKLFDATSPFATGGGYVNFMTADEQARVASAYGANYERLQEVKRRYDPDNLFRLNHNIAPSTPESPRPARTAKRRPAV
jgi:FAD/FMN-containing dehydrogenase